MNVRRLFGLSLLAAAAALTAAAQDQSRIANTKHNLTITGPGTIKASEETQLCVFCHTPHSTVDTPPLWNHQTSGAEYTLYSSEYLRSLNYTAPNQPNARSKLCLSCHDGTVALGAVYNNAGGSTAIAMQGGVTTMPAHAAGAIGTSLVNDHPVGYVYDPGRDPGLVGRPWPWGTAVRLDPDAAGGTVECHTCHEPHNNEHGSFLRMANTNAALCTFCHRTAGWTDAGHRTSTQLTTTPSGVSTTVGERACRSCHDSHGGGGVPFLLAAAEENTCFAAGCHGARRPGESTKNIQSSLEKLYAHPTVSADGRHRNPDLPENLNDPNRHAECGDCHDPHQAQAGLHTPGSNAVSPVLRGAPGVMPSPSPSWSQPAGYSEMRPALQEYQICYRCHSGYALGTVPGGVSLITGPSGVPITDQAMEFNPANASAHPVQVASGMRSGSPAPRELSPRAMSAPWTLTGAQTMYCGDCHGNDEETSSTVPQGPHGSEKRFMLTGRGTYWPASAGGGLWTLFDLRHDRNNWQNDLFCANCHVLARGGVFLNNVHEAPQHQGQRVTCVTCHVTVPHGSRRSRLIGYASDPAPYNYLGSGTLDRLVVTGFRKAAGPASYVKADCSTLTGCHGSQPGPHEP